MDKLNHGYWRDIIFSVGTHKKDRRLSPVEVSEGFILAKRQGMTTRQIADLVDLDTSIVGRFIKLSKLSLNIRHLIDWGWSDTTISFSVASEISNLNSDEQRQIIDFILKYSLVKSEVIQVLQIRQRTSKKIGECIEEILRLRPTIIKKYLFAGVITDKIVLNCINEMSQLKRGELFNKLLGEKIPSDIHWSARLGKKIFSIVGDEGLNDLIKKLEHNFEKVINKWLLEEIKNEK